jgi:hypothetical protein
VDIVFAPATEKQSSNPARVKVFFGKAKQMPLFINLTSYALVRVEQENKRKMGPRH